MSYEAGQKFVEAQWAKVMAAPFAFAFMAAVVAIATWWFRGHLAKSAIAGLKEQVVAAEKNAKHWEGVAKEFKEKAADLERRFLESETDRAKVNKAHDELQRAVQAAMSQKTVPPAALANVSFSSATATNALREYNYKQDGIRDALTGLINITIIPGWKPN